jgi:hypothetical protein
LLRRAAVRVPVSAGGHVVNFRARDRRRGNRSSGAELPSRVVEALRAHHAGAMTASDLAVEFAMLNPYEIGRLPEGVRERVLKVAADWTCASASDDLAAYATSVFRDVLQERAS